MPSTTSKLFACLALAAPFAIAACANESNSLTNKSNRVNTPAAAGTSQGSSADSTNDPSATTGDDFSHAPTPAAAGAAEDNVTPAEARAQGAPELTSRLHGCGKLTVGSVGQLLDTRGFTGKGTVPTGAMSGLAIYKAGDTAAALGAANFVGRVPEAPFASTSAISKMFDIYSMSSYDAVADGWSSTACPNTKLLDNGQFTKDGISCLIGKPATAEHVAIANDAIVKNPTDGAKIAVAALLAASHTCQ